MVNKHMAGEKSSTGKEHPPEASRNRKGYKQRSWE
jgi:hypothetical protein